jgi:hypothetical protein
MNAWNRVRDRSITLWPGSFCWCFVCPEYLGLMEVLLMKATQRTSRLLGIGVLLTICMVAIGILPPSDVSAVLVDETMDDDLPEFEQGGFIRSALYKDLPEDPDQPNDGHIQLTRMGSLAPLSQAGSSFQLPVPLYEHGAVTLGEHIYVIGGRTPSGDSNAHQDNVWVGQVDTSVRDANGLPTGVALVGDGWSAGPPLPETLGLEVQGVSPFSTTVGLADMAVTAYDNPDPSQYDYIYVLGGTSRKSETSPFFSSWSVYVGKVNPVTRRIEEWTTSDDVEVPSRTANPFPLRIPGQSFDGTDSTVNNNDQLGLHGAAATTVTVSDTTYLYLAGGAYLLPLGQAGTFREALPNAYVARIGEDGLLYKPGTEQDTDANLGWGPLDDIPVPDRNEFDTGLYNLMLVHGISPEGAAVLYAIAGQNAMGDVSGSTSPDYTNAVYRARILGEDDGSVDWDWTVNIETPLTAHNGVQINGSIFILGGFFSQGGGTLEDNPTRSGSSGYLEDDLKLHDFNVVPGNPPEYFQRPPLDNPDAQPLPEGRAHHAIAALSLGGADFIYVLGGQGPNGISSGASYFRLQESTPDTTPFAPTGWYTSRIYEIGLNDAQIEEITWDVTFPDGSSGTDIRMEYRGVNVADCDAPGWDESNWIPMDNSGDGWVLPTPPSGKNSSAGTNTYHIPEGIDGDRPTVSCFQYRALLTSSGDQESTPLLDRVGLKIFSPNSPDLNVVNLSPVWDERGEGFLEDMDITIQNLYESEPDRTLHANVESRIEQTEEGLIEYNFFYVDMFVFGPGFEYTEPVSITLPYGDDGAEIVGGGGARIQPVLTAGTEGQTCALSKLPLYPGATMDLNWWYEVQADSCVQSNLLDLFEQSGTYHVCLAIDAYVEERDTVGWPSGYVTENLEGAEDNNFTCTELNILVVSTLTLDYGIDIVPEGTNGTFTITRDKAPPIPLTVPFTLSGTATPGEDYTLLDSDGQEVTLTNNAGEVVIPANEASETLTLQTVDEGLLPREQKHETVVLTLVQDSEPQEYVIIPPSDATVKIEDPNAQFMIMLPMMAR